MARAQGPGALPNSKDGEAQIVLVVVAVRVPSRLWGKV